MPIMRMNHAVLYVRDVGTTQRFYEDVLGFTTKIEVAGQAAFLLAPGSGNDHDLGIFSVGAAAGPSQAGRGTVGLYHIAWEVDTLHELQRLAGRLSDAGALTGASDHGTTKAVYARDPDGLEFEVCWILPAEQVTEEIIAAMRSTPTRRLDLDAEIARFGGDLRGGVGFTTPTPTPTPVG